jgi:hypothetical protein
MEASFCPGGHAETPRTTESVQELPHVKGHERTGRKQNY